MSRARLKSLERRLNEIDSAPRWKTVKVPYEDTARGIFHEYLIKKGVDVEPMPKNQFVEMSVPANKAAEKFLASSCIGAKDKLAKKLGIKYPETTAKQGR